MISKTYITQIFVDGIPIQSFSSKMHEYIIRIPQIKKSLKIDVSTSNNTNHAIIKDHHGKEFPIGSIVYFNDNYKFLICLNSSNREESSYIYIKSHLLIHNLL